MPHLSTPVRTAVVAGCVALLAGTAAFVGAGSALAALPAQNETVMVSVDASTPPMAGDNESLTRSVSADGRFVAFGSSATTLVSQSNRGFTQVYVRDMITGVTTLVSLAASGAESGGGPSRGPSISADGRFVSFESTAPDLTLPADRGNTNFQVYVRDLVAGTTRKVSLKSGLNGGGDSDSISASISADGSLVAFESSADNLISGVTTTDTQVFLAKNAADPKIALVSVIDGGVNVPPNDDSVQPAISGDGNTVAFVSAASNVTTVPGNGKAQVYLRNISAGTTKLLTFSASDPTFAANNKSDSPSVSFDGSRVAYGSDALDLVAMKIGRTGPHVYLWDRALAGSTLVSIDTTNSLVGDGFSSVPSLSADGNVIAFSSLASNLTTLPTNGRSQVYLRNVKTATTTMVSTSFRDPSKGGAGNTANAVLAADGGYVAFSSLAPDLSSTTTAGATVQTYLRGLRAVGPTPTPTPTGDPTTTPTSTAGPGTPAPTGAGTTGAAGGQGGGSSSGGGHLASTGMSQTPIIVAAAVAGVLALIGGSILYGAHSAKRRRAQAASPSSPSSPLPDTDE